MVVMVTNPAGFRLGLRLLGIISLHVKLPSSLNLLGCRPNPNSSYRVCNYSFLITTILEYKIHCFHNTVSSINIVV
nr:MAG TPA: hypothetical protein [Caudoviricetes sp.]